MHFAFRSWIPSLQDVNYAKLHAQGWENRVNCCQRIFAKVPPTAILLTSDEAHIHLTGCVNKPNFLYWTRANSHELHERPFRSERVTVWCAVGEFGVLGPYFFEDEDGSAVTITTCLLHWNVGKFPAPQQNELAADVEDTWFQQDGATAHTAQRTMRYLREVVPRHIISHHGDIPAPARSSDLASCDFFLWGYLKGAVYKHRQCNLVELKTVIREEIQQITPAMTVRVIRNFKRRLNSCINTLGYPMEDVVFHK